MENKYFEECCDKALECCKQIVEMIMKGKYKIVDKNKQIIELNKYLEIIKDNENSKTYCSYRLRYVAYSLKRDAKAIYNNDPAANSIDEILICYPGYKAILHYRIANLFYKFGFKVFARYITEKAHKETGIDIHPGARIGNNFAIDHGTGIVIGETTKIGNNVVIYQGVTLGAIHLENRQQVGKKRHPTIKNNVVIYANATILGGKTVIGENSIIGANTFITKSVEPNSKVYFGKEVR